MDGKWLGIRETRKIVMLELGTKVRMVQTNSTGTIAGPITKSPVDGGDRILVTWDNSGMTNGWNPIFLRPQNTNPNNDPEIVSDGSIFRQKGTFEDKGNGLIVITGGGFQKEQ